MANSVRQNILTKIGTCLAYITSTNGYHNTVLSTSIYKGYKSIQEINEFPILFYGLGSEKLTDKSEDYDLLSSDCEIYIGVYFTSNTLTDDYEKWVRDLKRFVYQDSKMTSGKWLLLDGVDGVNYWTVNSIEQYLDYDKNIGSILLTINANYTEDTKEGL